YEAVQLGFSPLEEKRLSRPRAGHFKKAGVAVHRYLREVRIPADAPFEVGQALKADLFKAGELIDVTGIAKGKGFAGQHKRHHFGRGPVTHGSHNIKQPGSIGSSSTPSRVYKGMRLAGHLGSSQRTTRHLQVVRQQTNSRQGTHETKTRGEVSGGGKKPWRQKGTGRARQGSTRAPQWRHGGIVFGPHPHTYEQKMPRKQRRLALRAALSARSQEGAVRVVEETVLDEPKTRVVADLFAQMGAGTRVLFVIPEHDLMLEKSTRNLAGVRTILGTNLNPGDVLIADTIVFTRSALTAVEEWLT